mgnify:CR=1 FL=1|tara:strand:+ start:2240 stop:2506 length:267 start_codon:yes stop_codon:yes gene_type:complete
MNYLPKHNIKSRRIATGLYQAEYRGHVVTITDCRDEVEWCGPGTTFWAINSETIELEDGGDTLWATKREALWMIPDLIDYIMDGTWYH